MPPEILAVMDRSNVESSDESDSDSDDGKFVQANDLSWMAKNGVWSLAITLWEITSFGSRPFDSISDNQFVRFAMTQPITLTTTLGEMLIKV